MGEKSKKSKKAKMATMRIQLQANELFDKGKFDEAIEKVSFHLLNVWYLTLPLTLWLEGSGFDRSILLSFLFSIQFYFL